MTIKYNFITNVNPSISNVYPMYIQVYPPYSHYIATINVYPMILKLLKATMNMSSMYKVYLIKICKNYKG